MRIASPIVRWLLLPAALMASACRDNGPDEIGPPAQITVVAGSPQSALANTDLPTPIQVAVQDADGQGVPEVAVTFTIIAGGGSFPGGAISAAATTNSAGVATAPAWRLGKSAVAQQVRAQAGGVSREISATVETEYNIEVRFWGGSMTPDQQAFFTNAAARIGAIVTGDIIDADARGGTVNPSQCGVEGQPNLNEIIDDVLIYASIRPIDGSGKVLAQAGPCFVRGTATGDHTAVGIMQFDSADLNTLTQGGSLQDVITHEMMHVIGIGTLWGPDDRNLVSDAGTTNPRYTGSNGITGCQGTGGTVACSASVPLENEGGSGTVESHWRETTFNAELMTGFLDSGFNPLSLLTIGALEDLGFVVNEAAADTYMIFVNALRVESGLSTPRPVWENIQRPVGVLENGRVTPVRPR
jgi:hypothetical protein